MAHGTWMVAALLAAGQVAAAEPELQGHSVEAEGVAEARQLARVRGTRYSIPGTPAQVVGRAQSCLARRESGAGVVSVDGAAGRIVAVSRMPYGGDASPGTVKGRLTLEADAGGFALSLSQLGVLRGADSDGNDVFAPLLVRDEATWRPALVALVSVEQALVDCMFD